MGWLSWFSPCIHSRRPYIGNRGPETENLGRQRSLRHVENIYMMASLTGNTLDKRREADVSTGISRHDNTNMIAQVNQLRAISRVTSLDFSLMAERENTSMATSRDRSLDESGYTPMTAPGYTPMTAPGYTPMTAPGYTPMTAPRYTPMTAQRYAPMTVQGYMPMNASWQLPKAAPLYRPAYSTPLAGIRKKTHSRATFVYL